MYSVEGVTKDNVLIFEFFKENKPKVYSHHQQREREGKGRENRSTDRERRGGRRQQGSGGERGKKKEGKKRDRK